MSMALVKRAGSRIAIVAIVAAAIVGWSAVSLVFSSTDAAQATPPEQQAAAPAAPSGPSVWDGVYTKEQADRGGALYDEKCASCHGPTLTGTSSGGGSAPPLAGSVFNKSWDGWTLFDLYERTRVSMPEDDPGTLTPQQNVDIMADILQVGKFPAGRAELPVQLETLKQIQFKAKP